MLISSAPNNVGFNDARCSRKVFALCKRQAEGTVTTIVTEPAPSFNVTSTPEISPTTGAFDDSNWFDLNPVYISSANVSGPNSMANYNRFIFVADNQNHKIHKFQVMEDGTLSFIRKWGGTGSATGKFNTIGELAVSPDGLRLYVVDTNNRRVQVFDTAGEYQFSFGSFGTGNGQFQSPRGIAIRATSAGYVITITDTAAHQLQQFDSEGNFLRKWGEGLNAPASAAFGPDGTLYITDSHHNRVVAYHRLNNQVQLFAFGSYGSNAGQFSYPASVNIANDGKILVADAYNNRIQIFNSRGQYISSFGSVGGANGEFLHPLAVGISKPFIIVGNTMNERVDVFGQVTATVSP